ncbi:MAG: chemotaxis protein [Betaproteobacteria bacterium]|nr:chemotaxis protein [Betaproteobacteria bacterium]
MTVGKKILGGYAIVLVALAFVVAVAVYALKATEAAYASFLEVESAALVLATELGREARDQTAQYRGLLLYPEQQAQVVVELRNSHHQVDGLLQKLRALAQTEGGARLLGEISELQRAFKAHQERGIALLQQGQREEALTLDREALSRFLALRDKHEQFIAYERKQLIDGRARVAGELEVTLLWLASVSVAALVGGIALGLLLTRGITRALTESMARLASSSSEILATTTQVASGASETAAAVTETMATVEEVKQTAQLASQKARYVSETAAKAAEISHAGRASVEEAIALMQRIEAQMGSVGQSIVRLSEQSQAIGEITATVNDLAEQSNLLAVNAAIEAARAGEQGKGFSVVAQEVRSLAEQSKQATAQVRAILGDIQKATTAAVMATEQGSKTVEAGVRQSGEAGEAIRRLAESVAEAAQAATQIAASSQQQIVGMEQVALAIENIKQASMQNVAGTRQAESAAHDLHELGRRLGQMVAATHSAPA